MKVHGHMSRANSFIIQTYPSGFCSNKLGLQVIQLNTGYIYTLADIQIYHHVNERLLLGDETKRAPVDLKMQTSGTFFCLRETRNKSMCNQTWKSNFFLQKFCHVAESHIGHDLLLRDPVHGVTAIHSYLSRPIIFFVHQVWYDSSPSSLTGNINLPGYSLESINRVNDAPENAWT